MVYERFTKALEVSTVERERDDDDDDDDDDAQAMAGGAVEKLCIRCLQTVANLLAERPEGEQVRGAGESVYHSVEKLNRWMRE